MLLFIATGRLTTIASRWWLLLSTKNHWMLLLLLITICRLLLLLLLATIGGLLLLSWSEWTAGTSIRRRWSESSPIARWGAVSSWVRRCLSRILLLLSWCWWSHWGWSIGTRATQYWRRCWLRSYAVRLGRSGGWCGLLDRIAASVALSSSSEPTFVLIHKIELIWTKWKRYMLQIIIAYSWDFAIWRNTFISRISSISKDSFLPDSFCLNPNPCYQWD